MKPVMQKQTRYISEIDQFLQKFDHDHPNLSRSQQKEIAKHRRVSLLRDDPNHIDPERGFK